MLLINNARIPFVNLKVFVAIIKRSAYSAKSARVSITFLPEECQYYSALAYIPVADD